MITTEKGLNKVELLKRRKDGLDVLKDISQYASLGYDSIPKEEIELFKWLGLYGQSPKDGHFMLRVRIPSGILNSGQARALALISQEYGRNLVDLTTRQCVQFHWIRIEDIPEIFAKLDTVGLSTIEGCGDCPRNISGNPLAGIDAHELFDTRETVAEVEKFFLLNKDFSNLPRKFKISISANVYNNGYAELNDLAFTPAVKVKGDKIIRGFHVRVGGGLSHSPHLAKRLNIFITPENVLKVAQGVCTIFRDYGYRKNRGRARLKFLVEDWGIEKFEKKLVDLIGEMPSKGEDKILDYKPGLFTGLHSQKQKGLFYLGLPIPNGRLSAQDLLELTFLADKYGIGELRVSISKSILLTHIKKEMLADLRKEKAVLRYLSGSDNNSSTVTCTGKEFCGKALVRTKPWMDAINKYLSENFQGQLPVTIHMSGCPNSCGQTQIADIGLQGTIIKTEKGPQEAFEIYIGGKLRREARLATKLEGKILGELAPFLIKEFINLYLTFRKSNETFSQFVRRTGVTPFQKKLIEYRTGGKSRNTINDDIKKVI